jgi:hypothetical protein
MRFRELEYFRKSIHTCIKYPRSCAITLGELASPSTHGAKRVGHSAKASQNVRGVDRSRIQKAASGSWISLVNKSRSHN